MYVTLVGELNNKEAKCEVEDMEFSLYFPLIVLILL